MSGIVGIWNMDGAPVDRGLLGRMTDFMTFRGPDAQKIWIDSETGSVGFGQTLLKTTFEAEFEHQPFTLDGRGWIVADARVDAQDELIAKLNAKSDVGYRNVDWLTDPKRLKENRGQATLSTRGQAVLDKPAVSPFGTEEPVPGCHPDYLRKGSVTDVELILRAYLLWGEDCLDHLLGDFAFAIWDGEKKKLFCARDQLGVKPFFYAHIGQTVIFSNTLDCVRLHPMVSDELNDLAIADFLLFAMNQDPASSSYKDIQRIPPGHRATWKHDEHRINRYWTVPVDEPLYFKRAADYTGRFKELLNAAVSDRLRTNTVGVYMSGGLDSTSLAATACQILGARTSDSQVLASTNIIDGFDRNERHYATLAARHLGIPIQFHDYTTQAIDPDWAAAWVHTPEPANDVMALARTREEYRENAAQSRVWFYGEGPDNALHYEWKPYLSYLIRNRRFARLAWDVGDHVIQHRRIPLLPSLLRMIRQRRTNALQPAPGFPAWVQSELCARLNLESRWNAQDDLYPPPGRHPLRPWAYKSFTGPLWESLFRRFDSEETQAAMEVRHPFVDLRLLRFLLAVPALPWARTKFLMRRAMRGILPEPVLKRPKSPLSGDPFWEAGSARGFLALRAADGAGSSLDPYIDVLRVPEGPFSRDQFWMELRPHALQVWLRNSSRPHIDLEEDSLAGSSMAGKGECGVSV